MVYASNKMTNKILFPVFLAFFTLLASCNQPAVEGTAVSKINVGVFNGNGASTVCVFETIEALKIDSGIHPKEISAAQIICGELNHLDVLVFPGGSGSKEFNNLGLQAAEKVREFAKQQNKGVVGICAGGYLLASTPDYPSLNVLPVRSIRDYYNRGRGLISFSTNNLGNEIFPELDEMEQSFVQYYDGPMYENIDSSGFTVLATINTDIVTKEGYPKGVSVGKPAFGIANYGQGRIIMTTGHPEATSGMRWMVPRMARWAANKELIAYKKEVVRPEKYKKEVLYFPETIKWEKENFWKLASNDEDEILDAIAELHAIYSRPSIRWSIGLLRHTSQNVRIAAANYLLETEYTYAIPDLEAAFSLETDAEVKKVLGKVLQSLQAIIHLSPLIYDGNNSNIVATHIDCHTVRSFFRNIDLGLFGFPGQLLPDGYCLVNTSCTGWVPPANESAGCIHWHITITRGISFSNPVCTFTFCGKA